MKYILTLTLGVLVLMAINSCTDSLGDIKINRTNTRVISFNALSAGDSTEIFYTILMQDIKKQVQEKAANVQVNTISIDSLALSFPDTLNVNFENIRRAELFEKSTLIGKLPPSAAGKRILLQIPSNIQTDFKSAYDSGDTISVSLKIVAKDSIPKGQLITEFIFRIEGELTTK